LVKNTLHKFKLGYQIKSTLGVCFFWNTLFPDWK